MNDHDLGHTLDVIHADLQRAPAPDALRARVRAIPSTTVQQRRPWLAIPRWRFQSVFSATKFVIAAAIVALFGGFLLAGALPPGPTDEAGPLVGAPTSPTTEAVADATDEPSDGPPDAGRTLVVAQDGSAEFTTITEAVDAAANGDSVLIHPGTYEERVSVDKDITVRGEGDRSKVIIAPSDETEECQFQRHGDLRGALWIHCAIWLRDADANIGNLTLRSWSGEARGELYSDTYPPEPRALDAWPAMTWSGGSPRLEGLVVEGGIEGDAPQVEIRDSMVSGQILALGSHAILEDNVAGTIAAGGGEVVVRRNRVGKLDLDDATGVVEENEVVALDVPGHPRGVSIGEARPGLIFRENLVRGHRVGIRVSSDEDTRILRNRIEGNDRGISIVSTSQGTVIEDNKFCGNGTNVWVQNGPGLETAESCPDTE